MTPVNKNVGVNAEPVSDSLTLMDFFRYPLILNWERPFHPNLQGVIWMRDIPRA